MTGADAPRETQLLGGSVSASPGRSILDGGGGPAPAAVKTEAADAGANGDAGPSGGDDDGGDAKRQRLGESPDGSLSSHLLGVFSSELELSQQQVDALGAQKDLIRTDRENVTAALALMKELRQKVSDHMKTSQAITDGLRRILTPVQVTDRAILGNSGAILLRRRAPVQVAKFLMWVEKNKASMDLLNSLNHADLA